MEKLVRHKAPLWLAEKSESWGRDWAEKYNRSGKSSDFRWRRNRQKGYEDLVTELSRITSAHCSFCDAFPMGSRIQCTVEHFRPKTRFPKLAYDWMNLFLCCGICQACKGENFDENLLKPDEEEYRFDTYFQIDWVTGRINARIGQSVEARARAEKTIKLYGFNEKGKPQDRKRELNHFLKIENADCDEFAYRFFLKRGAPY